MKRHQKNQKTPRKTWRTVQSIRIVDTGSGEPRPTDYGRRGGLECLHPRGGCEARKVGSEVRWTNAISISIVVVSCQADLRPSLEKGTSGILTCVAAGKGVFGGFDLLLAPWAGG